MIIHLFFSIISSIFIPTLLVIELFRWGYPIIAITLAISNIGLLYLKKINFNTYINNAFMLINLVFIICIIKRIYNGD